MSEVQDANVVEPANPSPPTKAAPRKAAPKAPQEPVAQEDKHAALRAIAEQWLEEKRLVDAARREEAKARADAERREDLVLRLQARICDHGRRHLRLKDGTIIRVDLRDVEVLEITDA